MKVLVGICLLLFILGCRFASDDSISNAVSTFKLENTWSFLIDFQQDCPEAYQALVLSETYLISLNKVCIYK